jgi:hypothetical protein
MGAEHWLGGESLSVAANSPTLRADVVLVDRGASS